MLHLFGKVEVVSEPFPRLDLGNSKARATIRERCEEEEAPEGGGEDDTHGDPAAHQARRGDTLADRLRVSAAVTLDGGWHLGVLGFNAEHKFYQSTSD